MTDDTAYNATLVTFGTDGSVANLRVPEEMGSLAIIIGTAQTNGDKAVAGVKPGQQFIIDVYDSSDDVADGQHKQGVDLLATQAATNGLRFANVIALKTLNALVLGDPSNDQHRFIAEIAVPKGHEAEYWQQLLEAALKGLKGKQGPSMVLAMSLPGKIILVESWPDRSAHEVFVRSTLTDALLGLGLNPPQHVTMLRLTESTVHTGATA